MLVKKSQLFITPKEVEHRTPGAAECERVMFELETTLNTGDVKGDMTVEELE